MKKNQYLNLFLAGALIIGLTSCESQRPAGQNAGEQTESQVLHVGDNSEVSLDWAGTYIGVLPCADCPGIETALTMNMDGTYVLQTKYQERGDSVHVDQGAFTWDPTGSHITLGESEGIKFQVGENQLFHLDQEGNRIEGALSEFYILKKADLQITDIYWELIEINGQSMEGVALMKEAYIRLNSEDMRAEANGGCNGMGGTFTLDEENNRLSFSQLMSTKMACPNMEIEDQLADVLQRTDSYTVANDTLQLFRARMAPLAKFKAVYVSN